MGDSVGLNVGGSVGLSVGDSVSLSSGGVSPFPLGTVGDKVGGSPSTGSVGAIVSVNVVGAFVSGRPVAGALVSNNVVGTAVASGRPVVGALVSNNVVGTAVASGRPVVGALVSNADVGELVASTVVDGVGASVVTSVACCVGGAVGEAPPHDSGGFSANAQTCSRIQDASVLTRAKTEALEQSDRKLTL